MGRLDGNREGFAEPSSVPGECSPTVMLMPGGSVPSSLELSEASCGFGMVSACPGASEPMEDFVISVTPPASATSSAEARTVGASLTRTGGGSSESFADGVVAWGASGAASGAGGAPGAGAGSSVVGGAGSGAGAAWSSGEASGAGAISAAGAGVLCSVGAGGVSSSGLDLSRL